MTDLINTVQIDYNEEEDGASLSAVVHCSHEEAFREDIHLKLMYTHHIGHAALSCHGIPGDYLVLGTYEIRETEYAKQIEADIISGKYPYLTLLPND